MKQLIVRLIKALLFSAVVVAFYLTVWQANRSAPHYNTIGDMIRLCKARGGVYLATAEGYVCVKMERL